MLLGEDYDDTSTSTDESVQVMTEADIQAEDRTAAAQEYKRVASKWVKLEVDWSQHYPDMPEKPDIISDLMGLDIGKLYKKLETEKDSKGRSKYGLLPVMASCSYGQLGALNAESYAERVNSIGKLVCAEGNSLLSEEEVTMLVVLRMNRSFMKHMREHYGKYVREAFGMTVVDNEMMNNNSE